jgi:hypothetical protein
MPEIHAGRFTAQHDGDVVVFIIGARINRLRSVRKWLPVARAMGPMVKELLAHPDKGMLHVEQFFRGRNVMLVQYWKSFEHLERFARDRDDLHLPAWRAFNQKVGTSGSVGIFHETYLVPAGGFECIYNNMPAMGLAAATNHVPVARVGQSARYRAGQATDDQPAVPVPA